MKISISDVDDALSIQTKPCSAPYPHMRMIAVTPGRLALMRDRTVGPGRSVELPGVSAETVITLQLYNDDGPGHVRGVARDGEVARIKDKTGARSRSELVALVEMESSTDPA